MEHLQIQSFSSWTMNRRKAATLLCTKCPTLTVKNILHIRCASLHEDHKQLLEQCKSSAVCKILLVTHIVYLILYVIWLLFAEGWEADSWRHLEELYCRDGGAFRDASGLLLPPKIKFEHIKLTSYSKMCVELAAQVTVHVQMKIDVVSIYFVNTNSPYCYWPKMWRWNLDSVLHRLS